MMNAEFIHHSAFIILPSSRSVSPLPLPAYRERGKEPRPVGVGHSWTSRILLPREPRPPRQPRPSVSPVLGRDPFSRRLFHPAAGRFELLPPARDADRAAGDADRAAMAPGRVGL